jgi:hypothetical protein
VSATNQNEAQLGSSAQRDPSVPRKIVPVCSVKGRIYLIISRIAPGVV